jgi:hypothetical protein
MSYSSLVYWYNFYLGSSCPDMFKPSRTVRFLALAAIGFIGLNGLGAICLAYCGPEPEVASLNAHCSSMAGHMAPADPGSRKAAGNSSATLDCCPLTLVMVSAPLETPRKPAVAVQALPAQPPVVEFVGKPLSRSPVSAFHYRGPPPLDRRGERIRHSVFLI